MKFTKNVEKSHLKQQIECSQKTHSSSKNIKDAWRWRWDDIKVRLIRKGNWKHGENGEGSGFLQNPGTDFFLKLAADTVKDVNAQLGDNGITMLDPMWIFVRY